MNRKLNKCISGLIIIFLMFTLLSAGVNAADLKGNPSVTAVPPIIQRNDFTGSLGYCFTTTETLEVYALGRPENEGLTANHGVRIWNSTTQEMVAEVVITPTSPLKDGFRYEVLSAPVTLDASTTYLIVSDEEAGGDVWFDSDKRWYDVDVNFDVPSILSDKGITFDGGCFGGEVGAIPSNPKTEFVYVMPQMYYESKGAANDTPVTETTAAAAETEAAVTATVTPTSPQTSDSFMLYALIILGGAAAIIIVRKSVRR